MNNMPAAAPGQPKNAIVDDPIDFDKLPFKDKVLETVKRFTYVVNYRAKYKCEEVETLGINVETVRNQAMEWCKLRGFRFISVHPKFTDLLRKPVNIDDIDYEVVRNEPKG